MKSSAVDRRKVIIGIAGISFGTLIPHAAAENVYPSPADVGGIHGEWLGRISKALKDAKISTEKGLLNLISFLWLDEKLISEAEAKLLNELVAAIFHSANPDEMRKKIDDLEKEFAKDIRDVTAAIIRIAQSSIEYARQKVNEHPQLIKVVAADVSGAMTGASAAKKLGEKFVIAGVLLGAVGSSGWALFSSES